MAMRAQAVVIDALFFMLICGSAAALLFWASSVYGEKSYNAYKYMYLNDYETSVMSVLSGLGYEDTIGQHGNMRYFLDELGRFMAGDFDESYPRFTRMMEEWTKLCVQGQVPLSMEVFNEQQPETPRGNMSSHLFFACPLSTDGVKPKVYQSDESFSGGIRSITPFWGEHGTTLDPVYDRMYSDDTDVCERLQSGGLDCGSEDSATDYFCSDPGNNCDPAREPPYFASNIQRKLCFELLCVMQTKVYY